MKRAALCVIVIISAIVFSYAGRYARYNQVGFFPKAPKRIVIMSEDDCNGAGWIIKDKSGAIVLSGKTGASVCGKNDHMPFAFNYEIDGSALVTEGVFTFEAMRHRCFPESLCPGSAKQPALAARVARRIKRGA
jgi:hypothetical protein